MCVMYHLSLRLIIVQTDIWGTVQWTGQVFCSFFSEKQRLGVKRTHEVGERAFRDWPGWNGE